LKEIRNTRKKIIRIIRRKIKIKRNRGKIKKRIGKIIKRLNDNIIIRIVKVKEVVRIIRGFR
jgi:hypothetical protein